MYIGFVKNVHIEGDKHNGLCRVSVIELNMKNPLFKTYMVRFDLDPGHRLQLNKTEQPYLSHVMRKPVYAICEQQRRR